MAQLNIGKIGSIETNVKVSTLIDALTKFKAEHVEDYKVAIAGFNEKFLEKQKEAIKELKAATPNIDFRGLSWNFGLVKPINNETMYDQFIETFNSISTETITISVDQLNTIVNNSWDWVGTANATFASYNSKFAG